jgi:hypothetical protein
MFIQASKTFKKTYFKAFNIKMKKTHLKGFFTGIAKWDH